MCTFFCCYVGDADSAYSYEKQDLNNQFYLKTKFIYDSCRATGHVRYHMHIDRAQSYALHRNPKYPTYVAAPKCSGMDRLSNITVITSAGQTHTQRHSHSNRMCNVDRSSELLPA
jgi:hypothetical protein